MHFRFLLHERDTGSQLVGGVVVAESEQEGRSKISTALAHHNICEEEVTITFMGELFPSVTFFELANTFGL